jgi:hypothetical protein
VNWRGKWATILQRLERVDIGRSAHAITQVITCQVGDRLVTITYRPSALPKAEALLARHPARGGKWWRLVVVQVVDAHGPIELTPELAASGRRAIMHDYQVRETSLHGADE